MNEKEQIEEMAILVTAAYNNNQQKIFRDLQGSIVRESINPPIAIATKLYEAGYRRQSDTIKELEKKHTDILKEIIQNRLDYHCDKTKYRYELGKACVEFFISDIIKDLINELKKEYGVE